MDIVSHSEKDTFKIAAQIAQKLKPGDILALIGDLGSGKTVFVKGLARALGVKEAITSPTFVIAKEFAITKPQTSNLKSQNYGKNHLSLIHIDCYRIGMSDVESIGLMEYLDRDDAIVVIEWADRIEPLLPSRTKKMYFENLGDNKRKIGVNV